MGDSGTARAISDFYERNADFWAAERAKVVFSERKYVDRLLRERPVGSRVLDMGCGTGTPIGGYLIENGGSVTGCDVSAAMIEKARIRFPLSDWRIGDMRTFRFPEKFGAVIAWDSFHLILNEQREALPRFREHLVPGGVLLFTSGPAEGEQIGAMNGELLYHASLSPQEYQEILERLGFSEIEFIAKDETCGNHSVWFAKLGDDTV